MLQNPFDDQPARLETKVTLVYALLVAANIAAWIWALVAFKDEPALLGTAVLAYMFGLRHAFDSDHIAAIDNVVRKLMQEGKAPFASGFLLLAWAFQRSSCWLRLSLPRRRWRCEVTWRHFTRSAASSARLYRRCFCCLSASGQSPHPEKLMAGFHARSPGRARH